MISRRRSLVLLAALSLGFAAPALAQAPEPFRQEAFAAALAAGKPILVHVTAGWCPTCRAQKAVLAKLENDPRFKDLLVFDVDFDTSKPLLRQLGVQMQSTLIVYHGAKETGRMTGATDPAVIKRLLETSAS